MKYHIITNIKSASGVSTENYVSTKEQFYKEMQSLRNMGYQSNSLFLLNGNVDISFNSKPGKPLIKITGKATLVPDDFAIKSN